MSLLEEFSRYVSAEFLLFIRSLQSHKSVFVAVILWPYMLTLFILLLGTFIGSPQAFSRRLGGVDPVLYFLSSSAVLMISLVVMDDVCSKVLWDRELGTLDYVLSSVKSRVLYLLAVPVPHMTFSSLLFTATVAPALVLLKGVVHGVKLLFAIAVAALGAIAFAGFSMIIAGIVLALRESWSFLSMLRPLIMLVSGIYYPAYLMPLVLRAIAYTIPLTYTVDVIRLSVALETPESRIFLTAIAALIVMTLVYTPLGASVYSKLERRFLEEGGSGAAH